MNFINYWIFFDLINPTSCLTFRGKDDLRGKRQIGSRMELGLVPRKGCMDVNFIEQTQGLVAAGLLSELSKIFYILILYSGVVTMTLLLVSKVKSSK